MSSKKVITITSIISILALIIGFLLGGGYFIYTNTPKSEKLTFGDFNIHVMELGNQYTGDCIYIKSGETDILIDAGSRANSAGEIIEYVDQYVTDGKLEYVIATHADRDHISAFNGTSSQIGVLEYYDIDMIIDFPLTNSTTNTYKTYRENVEKKVASGTTHYTALECYNEEGDAKRIYQISDGVEMEILYNYYYDHKASDENNYSVCIMFNQGDSHYLFTGDLEKEGEEHLLEYYSGENSLPQCVFYKGAHHGSRTSNTKELLSVIQPEYVVVCCCAGTPEYTDEEANKFPTQEFIDNIAPYTDKVYIPTVVDEVILNEDGGKSYTVKSLNGDIVLSFGQGYVNVVCSVSETILKDSDWFKEYRTLPKEWQQEK